VAINRHEFLPQSPVASATRRLESRLFALVSASPSSLALVRGTTARSAVRADQRPSVVASPRAATSFHDGVFASQALGTSPARCRWSPLVTMVTAGTPDYVRLAEAT
jgi:hypothetical protein